MRVAVVLTFDLPTTEDITKVIDALDPPKLPFFVGDLRIVVEPHATEMLKWLDEDD